MSDRESIPFIMKGPITVQLPEQSPDQVDIRSGCAIVDLYFETPSQIGELVFTNYYTAWISVYLKRIPKEVTQEKEENWLALRNRGNSRSPIQRSFTVDTSGSNNTSKNNTLFVDEDTGDVWPSSSGSKRRRNSEPETEFADKPWECSIQMKTLMQSPHYESGSQDIFSIPATDSLIEWRNVVIMRLVIRQPSSAWKRFAIEDVNVFRYLPKRGCSHSDEVLRQRDNWFGILKKNTKGMLSGQLVEPENCDSDEAGA